MVCARPRHPKDLSFIQESFRCTEIANGLRRIWSTLVDSSLLTSSNELVSNIHTPSNAVELHLNFLDLHRIVQCEEVEALDGEDLGTNTGKLPLPEDPIDVVCSCDGVHGESLYALERRSIEDTFDIVLLVCESCGVELLENAIVSGLQDMEHNYWG